MIARVDPLHPCEIELLERVNEYAPICFSTLFDGLEPRWAVRAWGVLIDRGLLSEDERGRAVATDRVCELVW